MTVQVIPTRGTLRVLRGDGPAVTTTALSVAVHSAAGGALITSAATAAALGTGTAAAHGLGVGIRALLRSRRSNS